MAELKPGNRVIKDFNSYRIKGATADRYYTTPLEGDNLNTLVMPAHNLIAIAFPTPVTIILDKIAVNITTGSVGASNIRLGIYKDNGNLYPDSLVLDAGTVDSSAAGGGGVKTITINQKLLKNTLYWLVLVSNGSPTVRNAPIAPCIPVVGYDSSLPTQPGSRYLIAFVFAPLPSTFPAGATSSAGGNSPLVFVRLSS